MVNDPSGWLCVADPDWLDFLAGQSDLNSLIYYKGPYRPTTKLPRNTPFVCCRRGEKPRRIHLIGMFNGYVVLNRNEAWNRYSRSLGVPDHVHWKNVDVGADNLISCHELVNFCFLEIPPLLADSGVLITDAASSMGRYLSGIEAQQILKFVGDTNPNTPIFPDQVLNSVGLFEGTLTKVFVNVYERNAEARRQCIAHYEPKCAVCKFVFHDRYGKIGEGFIHVHHLVPLSTITESYRINPITDLRPVCPNCHAMIHAKSPPYSIEEMREIVNRMGDRSGSPLTG